MDENLLEPILKEHLLGLRILDILTAPMNADGSGRHSVTIALENDVRLNFSVEYCVVAHRNGVAEWLSKEYAQLRAHIMGDLRG